MSIADSDFSCLEERVGQRTAPGTHAVEEPAATQQTLSQASKREMTSPRPQQGTRDLQGFGHDANRRETFPRDQCLKSQTASMAHLGGASRTDAAADAVQGGAHQPVYSMTLVKTPTITAAS